MPRRSQWWVWTGRVVFGLLVVGVVAYLAIVGLDRADKTASSIGAVVALIALGALYLLPPPHDGGVSALDRDRPESEATTGPQRGPAAPTTDDESRSTTPRTATDSGSGDTSAFMGGVVNIGTIHGGVQTEYHHHAPARPQWPVVVGRPPALASAFQPRQDLRDVILDGRRNGDDAVLAHGVHGDYPRTPVLVGGGGVGKTQLAAWFALQAISRRKTDLVVWVDAASPHAVMSAYASAAKKACIPGAAGDDVAAAGMALVEWMHSTDQTWLVVLDDITDPAGLNNWWPPLRPTGWTLATSRLQDATLISSGRRQVDVDVYSRDESLTYLTDRLTEEARYAELLDDHALDLATAVGHLPLALSHAAAYMMAQGKGCKAYWEDYRQGHERLLALMPAEAKPDAYNRPVTVTLLLALNVAGTDELARPVLELAAMLDPAGHPDALWSTPAATEYLSTRRPGDVGQPVTADQARGTVRLLHRYGLLSHTPTDIARGVRIHALTARAVQEITTDPEAVAHAAAAALLQLWPAIDHDSKDLVVALRTNTATLVGSAGDLLWRPKQHALLDRAGTSLLHAGLHASAAAYWADMTDRAVRLLGDKHVDTLTARANLAVAYWQAGRTTDAITLLKEVIADRVRLLGDDHPDTLIARANLAACYRQAGRITDAITLLEGVRSDRVRQLGNDHSDTLTVSANLAACYWKAGRATDAITLLDAVTVDSARVLGEKHPDTVATVGALRAWRGQA
jgi:tetratricopeptide (TPR) repeat protein